MLGNWDEIGKMYRLFIIDERWGIRDHTIPKSSPPVLMHRCDTGRIGHIHDIKRCEFKCKECKINIPEEIQALWLLGTWNFNERWMK